MIGHVPTALAVLIVLLVGLAAKLPEAVLPIGTDTGMYATYGRMILQGARPYVDFYDVHPPLTYYYWAAIQAAVGTDWSRACLGSWGTLAPQPCISLVAHALDLGLSLVAALLVYAIARSVGLGRGVGLLAGVLVAWFANAAMLSMEGSNPTKLTLVPSTLAVYAYVRGLEGRPNRPTFVRQTVPRNAATGRFGHSEGCSAAFPGVRRRARQFPRAPTRSGHACQGPALGRPRATSRDDP